MEKSRIHTVPDSPSVILVVESDPLMLTGMAAVLDKRGYRCFLARDRAVAARAADSLNLDLVILSVDDDPQAAIELAKDLRSRSGAVDVPIVFATSQMDAKSLEKLQSAGGIACLAKPFDPQALTDLVDQSLWVPHLVQSHLAPPPAHFSQAWVRLK